MYGVQACLPQQLRDDVKDGNAETDWQQSDATTAAAFVEGTSLVPSTPQIDGENGLVCGEGVPGGLLAPSDTASMRRLHRDARGDVTKSSTLPPTDMQSFSTS